MAKIKNMNDSQNNQISYPRGSEWRKWDLHIHSPSSGLNNQYPKNPDGSPDWDSFINRLEEIIDVSVIGVTDYFFIDGYKKVTEFRDRGRLKNFDLILPNVELRLDTFVVRNKSKDINFHVIFSNELKIEDIEKEFIGALDIQISGSVSGLDGVRQLNKRSISEIGKKIKRYHSIFKNDSDEEAAFKNITVSLKQVQKLLRKDLFKDKFLFVLSGHEWADIDWNQAYLTKKNFLQTAHVLETGSSDTINWALGKKDLSEEDFIKEFGRLKPCIFGSDAHHLDKICKPEDNKFCWIKADPTFDGLKYIIHEPETRVYIGKSPTKGKNDAEVIDRIEIRSSNNWFEEKPVLLNDNLINIIGEKGAGKTALADFIGLAGGDFNIKEEDPGSFIFKALRSTKQIEDTVEGCVVTIYWQDGSSDLITITDDFKDYKDFKKVRYLSQNFIEKKCRPEQTGELKKEIEDIIFQHIPVQDRLGLTSFTDLKRLKTQSIELKKSKYKETISGLNEAIFNLEEEINSLKMKKEEKGELQAEITQLKRQKPKPTTEEEKNIEEKLTFLNNRKNQLNKQIANYKLQLNTIDTVKTKVATLKDYVNKSLVDIKKDLESIDLVGLHKKLKFSISTDFDKKLNDKKEEMEAQIKELQWDQLTDEDIDKNRLKELKELDFNTLTTDYISTLSLYEVNTLISILEKKSSIAEAQRKVIKSFEEKIEKNQKKIDELKKNIREIEEVKIPLLPEKIKKREGIHKEYFVLLQKEKEILEELYTPLKEKLNNKENTEEQNQLEFSARIEVNVEEFFNKADEIIDFNRMGRYYRNRKLLFKKIKTISEKIELAEELNVNVHISQLYKTFEQGSKGETIDINDQLSKGKKKIDFYNWIFDVSDFSVTYGIKYQGTNLELLSPGKKGIVLLLMYLALDTESSIPLIIDQPEENLDNKSVYKYLIDYFKIAKKRRQIIVITHNPNLVLNTDAEQIIIANFEAVPTSQDTRIKYISGAIENSFIRKEAKLPLERKGIKEHGIDLLEGGPTAFTKRRDKYDLKNQ